MRRQTLAQCLSGSFHVIGYELSQYRTCGESKCGIKNEVTLVDKAKNKLASILLIPG